MWTHHASVAVQRPSSQRSKHQVTMAVQWQHKRKQEGIPFQPSDGQSCHVDSRQTSLPGASGGIPPSFLFLPTGLRCTPSPQHYPKNMWRLLFRHLEDLSSGKPQRGLHILEREYGSQALVSAVWQTGSVMKDVTFYRPELKCKTWGRCLKKLTNHYVPDQFLVKIKAQHTEGEIITRHLETAGREEGCRKCDNSVCHCVVVMPQLYVWKAVQWRMRPTCFVSCWRWTNVKLREHRSKIQP